MVVALVGKNDECPVFNHNDKRGEGEKCGAGQVIGFR